MDGGDDGMMTDDPEEDEDMATKGRGMVSFTAEVDDLPVSVMVRAAMDQTNDTKATTDDVDMGEQWKQGDALTHKHDGLMLPADNTAEKNDLGSIYVTFTTQSLTVGIHRELDDREGFTDHIGSAAATRVRRATPTRWSRSA